MQAQLFCCIYFKLICKIIRIQCTTVCLVCHKMPFQLLFDNGVQEIHFSPIKLLSSADYNLPQSRPYYTITTTGHFLHVLIVYNYSYITQPWIQFISFNSCMYFSISLTKTRPTMFYILLVIILSLYWWCSTHVGTYCMVGAIRFGHVLLYQGFRVPDLHAWVQTCVLHNYYTQPLLVV